MRTIINGKWTSEEMAMYSKLTIKSINNIDYFRGEEDLAGLVHNDIKYLLQIARGGKGGVIIDIDNNIRQVSIESGVMIIDGNYYLTDQKWTYVFNTYQGYKDWSEGCVDVASELDKELLNYIPEKYHEGLGL